MRIGAMDFGLTKDWAAFVAIENRNGDLFMIHKKIWKGSRSSPVEVAEVENYMRAAVPALELDTLVIERWEMVATIQKLTGELTCKVEEFIPTAQSVVAISQVFFQVIESAKFHYPASDTDFTSELQELEAEESRAAGHAYDKGAFKIVYRRRAGGQGHGDTSRAVSIAAFYAIQDYHRTLAEMLADTELGGERGGGSHGDRMLNIDVESTVDGDFGEMGRVFNGGDIETDGGMGGGIW